MQTFLPYPDFKQSVQVLDYRRLGKQRTEVVTILKAMNGLTKKAGYANHPAATMWHGHQYQLCQYGLASCEEWIGRGYKDTQRHVIAMFLDSSRDTGMPWWFGIEKFHDAHQSKLISKMPEFYYPKFGYFMPDDLPYLWPTIIDGRKYWKIIR